MRTELRGGRLIDVAAGAPFPEGTSIVIRDDRIESVGPPPDEPADAVVELHGRNLFPGLFNTHCHPDVVPPALLPGPVDIWRARRHATEQRAHTARLCLEHGVTTLRDAFCADLAVRRELARLPGPRIRGAVVVGPPGGYLSEGYGRPLRWLRSLLGVPAGDPASPTGGVVLFDVQATPGEVRDAVDRAVDERGADHIKIGEQEMDLSTMRPTMTVMSQVQLDALADQARRRGAPAQIHYMTVATFRRAVRAGVGTLSHIPVDADLDDDDVRAFIAADLAIEPTLSVAYGLAWPIPGDPNRDHPDMVQLSSFRAARRERLARRFYVPGLSGRVDRSLRSLEQGRFRLLGLMDARPFVAYYAPAVSHGIRNFRRLFRAGARVALGNDGGVPPCTPAMVGLELALMDMALRGDGGPGLTGADALRVATLASAEATGLADELGSLAPGKRADLVIVDGDPLADFTVVGGPVAGLYLDGERIIG